MIVHLKMPDEIYEGYAHYSTEVASRLNGSSEATPEVLMVAQLARFAAVPPMDRPLVVGSAVRDELERILSGGTLRDDQDLLAKVRRLADVSIEGVALHFTPAQLQQIRNYATRNALSPEETVRRIVRQMEHQFFDFVSEI